MNRTFIIHSHPLLPEAADSLILAKVTLTPDSGATEQLYARQTGPAIFELACIPFYVIGLSFGDEVEVSASRLFRRITVKRAHKTLRIANRSSLKLDA